MVWALRCLAHDSSSWPGSKTSPSIADCGDMICRNAKGKKILFGGTSSLLSKSKVIFGRSPFVTIPFEESFLELIFLMFRVE